MDFLLVINGSLMTVGTAVEWEYFLWSLEFSLSKLIGLLDTLPLLVRRPSSIPSQCLLVLSVGFEELSEWFLP
ncbi:hypothetical protein M0802_014987 [Mischocyttarus mexicanus]|nr:hypothetical protein M0802_014987 [Mischocyttarus mexicanus]